MRKARAHDPVLQKLIDVVLAEDDDGDVRLADLLLMKIMKFGVHGPELPPPFRKYRKARVITPAVADFGYVKAGRMRSCCPA